MVDTVIKQKKVKEIFDFTLYIQVTLRFLIQVIILFCQLIVLPLLIYLYLIKLNDNLSIADNISLMSILYIVIGIHVTTRFFKTSNRLNIKKYISIKKYLNILSISVLTIALLSIIYIYFMIWRGSYFSLSDMIILSNYIETFFPIFIIVNIFGFTPLPPKNVNLTTGDLNDENKQ